MVELVSGFLVFVQILKPCDSDITARTNDKTNSERIKGGGSSAKHTHTSAVMTNKQAQCNIDLSFQILNLVFQLKDSCFEHFQHDYVHTP